MRFFNRKQTPEAKSGWVSIPLLPNPQFGQEAQPEFFYDPSSFPGGLPEAVIEAARQRRDARQAPPKQPRSNIDILFDIMARQGVRRP